MTWAHHALLNNDRKGLTVGLALTVMLGMIFTVLQAIEYSHAGFSFAGHSYGSTFFMATGFHGAHVIIGTIFLAVCLVRAMRGAFTPKQHFGFEAAAWYWHFVDVVWLFLFACIYVWGAGDGGCRCRAAQPGTDRLACWRSTGKAAMGRLSFFVAAAYEGCKHPERGFCRVSAKRRFAATWRASPANARAAARVRCSCRS